MRQSKTIKILLTLAGDENFLQWILKNTSEFLRQKLQVSIPWLQFNKRQLHLLYAYQYAKALDLDQRVVVAALNLQAIVVVLCYKATIPD